MKTKKILVKAVISTCLLGLLFFCFLLYRRNKEVNDLEEQGFKLAQKVEAYKNKYHALPNTLDDIAPNLPDDYPLDYVVRRDSINYEIWFQIGFFKSMVYHSDSKKWRYTH
jgi:hypothetical protein